MSDRIRVVDLVVSSRVGVPVKERSAAQQLLVTLELDVDLTDAIRRDDLNATVDYAAVAERVRQLAGAGEYLLIERLAGEIASRLLEDVRINSVQVEIKKFILPQVGHVAVMLRRSKLPGAAPLQKT